ncbi:hypothetical protein NQ314_019152 [Rhamnusium bicolor]|uniref:Lipase domain-containing protein n=1 Tax=Rhamnusium bicolor TaxID=1586634 RepID=A0AAV8WPR9_9CUCU|nr:hypothetical protein NQ314_019152 [Rhamnusium bicolor]
MVNIKYFLVETRDGLFRIEDLRFLDFLFPKAYASDVKYHYFSRDNPTKAIVVGHKDARVFAKTDFNASRDTLLIIHGWTGDSTAEVNIGVRKAVLAKHDINVFVIDWGPAAKRNYAAAKWVVSDIGEYIADFLKTLVSTYHLKISRVACVGFSLGAHVCGNVGESLNGQLGHIVGLDPASPLFLILKKSGRLDSSDAKFVQVIHTSTTISFATSIGHADYFPNGGVKQPGCGDIIYQKCSHHRAHKYYTESISTNGKKFVSKRCSGYIDYTFGSCKSKIKSLMGDYKIDTK